MAEEKEPAAYGGKLISEMSLWELGDLEKILNKSLAAREEAAKHPKFGTMELPPPNPKFLELKNAVELAIKNKQEQGNA
jgi:hypothetical protein